MREIKFRALLDSGQWIYLTIHSGHRKFESGSDYFVKDSKITTNWLQYTGLKDKTGKEIYESDFLFITTTVHSYYMPVIWDQDCWTLKDDGTYGTLSYDGTHGTLSEWNEDSVIIGNIYENPELIEE